MKIDKITPYIATGIVCAGVTFGLCWYFMDFSRKDIIEAGQEFSVIKECENFLDENTETKKDDNARIAAINGYLQSIGDEYTLYYKDEEDDVKFQTDYINSSGTADASGFQVDISEDGNILLTEVKKGFSADNQGLKKDDIITHIDGVSISEHGYENYANKILGKDGTKVNLTINRNGEIFDIEFTRSHHYINNCEYERIGNVQYIKIRHIDRFMQGQLDQSLRDADNTNKIIFDMRNCPGGEIYTVVTIAAQLSGSAKVDKYFNNGYIENCFEEYDTRCAGKEIVLLVNENTASAAEIFTAVMKQNLDVTIVGTNTFGKGIFQEFKELSDGAQLRYTAGYFTVGDWDCWQGIGIAPDIEVEMDNALIGTEDDVQLAKALEILE